MIVVTTPTGTIGRQLLSRLLDSGQPVRVVARDPARLPANVRERVEVIAGSHGDAATIDRALTGAEALFWLPPPNPVATSVDEAFVKFAEPACRAVERHGVARVVVVSALGKGLGLDAGFVSATHAVDEMFARTGAHLRALAMPSFMENLLRQVAAIAHLHTFFSPIDGDTKMPSCATRDIAEVAARLLIDRAWTGQETVPVLGPEDLSPNDMARILSEVLGKPIRFQQIPLDVFRSRMLENGMSPAMAQAYCDMFAAKNAGLDNAEPRTAANTTPTSFRAWCADTLIPALAAAA